MKSFKTITSLLLAGVIGGSSLGSLPLHANAAASITNEQSYTQPFTNERSSHPSGFIPPQSTMMKWNLTISSDMLGISGKINDILQRTTFQNLIRELADQTFSVANNRYNVMVFTADFQYRYHFEGIKFHATISYFGKTYHMYVFEKGTFNTYNHVQTKPWAWAYKGWIQGNTGANIQFYLPKMGIHSSNL
ncbi:hypothetical protein BM86_34520 [Bacillus thuringiensis]|uniref:Uncharacterized protein n=1 Tax=Bacillus thuringiensis TaxID=1428 RepID=A0A9W3SIJ6_BACTU|nr:hypothetical protein [Bacillus thuringiensis]ANS52103.1 hypothetical protein BT246_68120 [Bacillus thuringiensis]MBH0340410.1 hypothetical protein [Bacillus thuringiensis]